MSLPKKLIDTMAERWVSVTSVRGGVTETEDGDFITVHDGWLRLKQRDAEVWILEQEIISVTIQDVYGPDLADDAAREDRLR